MKDINICLPNPRNFPSVILGSLKPFPYAYLYLVYVGTGARGGAVVEELRYKPVGRGIDSRCCLCNFSLI
jgi:hypothetical protein